ncbi:MAG: type I DNA topoisomerase [Patescibacteria group bacterium]
MSQNLVIVESPTKAKTISRFLGSGFIVVSSYGHVRDLPKSKMGVAVDDNFTPQYIIPTKAKKLVTSLIKQGREADCIYFATDEDREGEAIAWHLVEVMKPKAEKIKRIVFHEITKEAIDEALQQPRALDINLINAQQARRILDRLVGYELSPFLWKKVARGLSAGRVQSVTVRLIVEREREINNFTAQEYWSIEGIFKAEQNKFEANLVRYQDQVLDKFFITNQQQAEKITADLQSKQWLVGNINNRTIKKPPPAPFTTSTLQQEANHRLGFSVKQTMMLAQQLYEGIELDSEGSVGLITYMRTDSVNLANKFLQEAKQFIAKEFGDQYARTAPRTYTTKSKLAQEAHEAIRPTQANKTPELVKPYLDPKQYKLYQLIWQRAVASQLPDAELEATSLEATDTSRQSIFRASGQRLIFPGWYKLTPDQPEQKILPVITVNDTLILEKTIPNQHFTEPPARYSEATLVKALEEYGIGRPSTYAPTIGTIITRGYVEKIQRRLKPTDIAILVNDLLVEHFPEIVDYQFTAKLENELDNIAEGKAEWIPIIREFYLPFKGHINSKEQEVQKKDLMKERELGIDNITGLAIKARLGRYGPYLQLGEAVKDGEKPKFVSLLPGMSTETITLDQAKQLLALPRALGQDESGKEILAGIGRFGPYLKREQEYRSLTADDSVLTITLERALDIFKNQLPRNGTIATLGIDPKTNTEVVVKTGRFGPYVTNGKINASLPKNQDPREVKLDQALELLVKKANGPKRGRKKQNNTFYNPTNTSP